MIRVLVSRLATALIIIMVGHVTPVALYAQEFPYQAPDAPEFDSRGNYLGAAAAERNSSRGKERDRPPVSRESSVAGTYPQQQSERAQQDYLMAPGPLEAPKAPVQYGTPENPSRSFGNFVPGQQPAYKPTSKPPPQVAATSRVIPPSAQSANVRQDCSQFPLLIAAARSESEMQFTARRYLTCLIENGMNMDEARQFVINAIESSFRVSR